MFNYIRQKYILWRYSKEIDDYRQRIEWEKRVRSAIISGVCNGTNFVQKNI